MGSPSGSKDGDKKGVKIGDGKKVDPKQEGGCC